MSTISGFTIIADWSTADGYCIIEPNESGNIDAKRVFGKKQTSPPSSLSVAADYSADGGTFVYDSASDTLTFGGE